MSLHQFPKFGHWLCKFCQHNHRSTFPGQAVVFYRNKFSQRLKKQEQKKQTEYQYVGENAKKTSIIYAWGSTMSGALGIPSFLKPELKFKGNGYQLSKMNRPSRVRFFDQHKIKPLGIACGYGFTVISAKYQNQKILLGTGINSDSQIGYHEVPKGSGRVLDQLIEPGKIRLPLTKPDVCEVVTMSCGRSHTVIVVKDEGVFTLGNNAYGQCGRGIVEGESYNKNPTINKLKNIPDDIIQVVCGQDHSLFLTSSGEVYSCGLGADGQTGVGHYNCTDQLTQVKGDLEGERIVSLGSKGDCSLAVSEKGQLFGWGNSEYSQLGTVTSETQVNVPRALPVSQCGKVIKAVAGGSICALLNDQGQVYVWGYGILGKGPNLESSSQPSLIPEPIFGRSELSPDTKVVDIGCGLTHFVARTDKNDLYTWGRNIRGCLGLGLNNNQFFPWRVSLAADPVKYDCGPDHMIVLCKSFT